jgi:hypothetical protein
VPHDALCRVLWHTTQQGGPGRHLGTPPGMKAPCQLCGTRKPAEMTCPNPACPSHRRKDRPSAPRRTVGS